MHYHYYVYIITNLNKSVLYTGVTNNLEHRLIEHYLNTLSKQGFTGKYNVCYLLFYEVYQYIDQAIRREKEIKGWTREKKCALINTINPEWNFLNSELFDSWPPKDVFYRKNSDSL
jgi:putative endonuclease